MTLLGDKQLQNLADAKDVVKIAPSQWLADLPWIKDDTHKGAERSSGVAAHLGSGGRMIVKDASPAQNAEGKEAPVQAEQAAEAAHLAGSALVTGAVAVVLTVVAIPVSIGLGISWGAKSLARRLRGK